MQERYCSVRARWVLSSDTLGKRACASMMHLWMAASRVASCAPAFDANEKADSPITNAAIVLLFMARLPDDSRARLLVFDVVVFRKNQQSEIGPWSNSKAPRVR